MLVKNTLLIKALDALEQDYSPLYDILKGGSSVMLSETASAPAKLIKDFRKEENQEKPILKGAYIDTDFFIGDEHLDELAKLKSKEDLLGEGHVLPDFRLARDGRGLADLRHFRAGPWTRTFPFTISQFELQNSRKKMCNHSGRK